MREIAHFCTANRYDQTTLFILITLRENDGAFSIGYSCEKACIQGGQCFYS